MTGLSAPGSRFLLVGTGNYASGSELREVPAVAATLTDLRQLLIRRCGVAEDRIRLLEDPETPTEVGVALAEQAEAAEGVLFFYYVGHGRVSLAGELYLDVRLTDRRHNRLPHTGLAYASIRNSLLDSNAEAKVVMLDCCYSGRALTALGPADDTQAGELARVHGGFVLTASGRNELSHAPVGARHTAFTGELIRLLDKGDPGGPPELTLRSISRGLRRELPARGFPEPHLVASEGIEDLVLAANPAYQPRDPLPAPATPEAVVDQVCPYPGLAGFDTKHAGWFFGRTRLVDELATRLGEHVTGSGPCVVVGPSGSGKSSLLRAGLVPALRRGALPVPGSASWPWILLTPGADPVGRLAAQLAPLVAMTEEAVLAELSADPPQIVALARRVLRAASDGQMVGAARLVLIVDQFEEIFTQCLNEQRRRSFIRLLTAATLDTDDDGPPILAVLGLRADFYGSCAADAELVTALRDNQVLVGPMTTGELREAIEAPAAVVGLTLAPGLVEVLLQDIGAGSDLAGSDDGGQAALAPAAGALPLLSHALRETWGNRHGRLLTVAGYLDAGGIHGAVAATAETLCQSLDGDDQTILRQLLLRMVTLGDGVPDSKRPLDRGDLVDDIPDTRLPVVRAVLDKLVATRLVTLDQDTVTIAHEALLHAWPRLREWIEEDRAALLMDQQLREAAAAWDRETRDPGFLYRGTRLELARSRTLPGRPGLGRREEQFLQASLDAEDAEETAARRRARNLRALLGGLAVLLAGSLVASGVAVWQQQVAVEQKGVAVSRQLGVESQAAALNDPRRQLLLAAAAWQTAPTEQARGALLSAAHTEYAGTLSGSDGPITRVAISPDGTVAATGQSNGTVWLWDTTTHSQTRQLTARTGENTLAGLAFSPDGRTLATSQWIKGALCETQCVRLWDVATGSVVRSLPSAASGVIAFSPDGAHLASALGTRFTWWELSTGRLVSVIDDARDDTPTGIAASPDGHTLATSHASGLVRLWDITTGGVVAELTGHTRFATSVAFSPDGTSLASGGGDGVVRLWDVAARKQRLVLSDSASDGVSQVAFSPDGTRVAAAKGKFVQQWVAAGGARLNSLVQHTNVVDAIAYAANGHELISGSADSTAVLWDPDRYYLAQHRNAIFDVAVSPDGSQAATAGADGTVVVTDTLRRRPPRVLAGHTDMVHAAAFSPDGQTLATAGDDRTVRLWDAHTGEARQTLATNGLAVLALAFSPDGRMLAATTHPTNDEILAGKSGGPATFPVLRWDMPGMTPAPQIILPGDRTEALDLSFSGDSAVLALALSTGRVDLSGAHSGKELNELSGHTPKTNSVAFSPDGRMLATAGEDRTVRLWDAADGHQIRTLTGHGGAVTAVAFSPDGHTLASASSDNTLRLWDAATGEAIATLTGRPDNEYYTLAYSPDGHTLAAGGTDGILRLWTADAQQATQTICDALASPALSSEWATAVPDLATRLLCPN